LLKNPASDKSLRSFGPTIYSTIDLAVAIFTAVKLSAKKRLWQMRFKKTVVDKEVTAISIQGSSKIVQGFASFVGEHLEYNLRTS
jgi:hypothetical protein